MPDEKALVPVEQKKVIFYDDEITAVVIQTKVRQEVFVPIRPICAFLGVAWTAQRQRILRDPVLSEELTPVIVTITGTGQQVESLCLPLDYLSGWLFGINATRVKDEVRDQLVRYQRECYKVLSEAFQEGRLTADPVLSELLQIDSEAVQAYKMLQAMVKLARNQILLEAQVGTHTTQLADHGQRLEEIESTLGDTGRNVTPEQASQISQAVKAVAIALGKQTKKNEFGAIYGELYRKFGITSYKLLPASAFEPAMGWLSEWYQQVADGDDVPF
jgi:ferritin-like metal-binding protein YciE